MEFPVSPKPDFLLLTGIDSSAIVKKKGRHHEGRIEKDVHASYYHRRDT